MTLLFLLLIAVSLNSAMACLAMKPGILPCPSPPLLKMTPPGNSEHEYFSAIGPEIINGERIYKCKYGKLQLYGYPSELDSTLVCRPDTGHYWRKYANGKEVYVQPTEAFICEEKACPPAGDFEVPQLPNLPKPFVEDGPITIEKGDPSIVLKCPEGSVLYQIGAGGEATIVQPADMPMCKRNSGGWDTVPKPVYKCLKTPDTGIAPCQDGCTTLMPGMLEVEAQGNMCKVDPNIIVFIRGVDASGKCVTLDNDGPRKLAYDMNEKLWIYDKDTSHGRDSVYLKAASCATAISPNPPGCGCKPLPLMSSDFDDKFAPGVMKYPALTDGGNTCSDTSMKLWYTLPKTGGLNIIQTGYNDPTKWTIECSAGMWIMDHKPPRWGGWVIAEATCWKP